MKTLNYQVSQSSLKQTVILENDELETTFIKGPLKGHPKTLIIIPAFNEEKNIGAVLDAIQQKAPGVPILVINDGSADKTESVARSHGANVISLPFNSGYGVALQTGFKFAVRKNYAIVIQMDSDGQHDPKNVQELIKEVQKEDIDVVIGSRFLDSSTYKTSWARHIGIFIFGKIASLFCGHKVTDPTSGFQALKGKAIHFAASDHYPPDYPDADFIILMHRYGLKVKEIPVTMHASPEKESMHHGHKTIYYIFKMFLSIFVTILRNVSKG